jgi:methylmalonyl-CoA mutase cobalamin-binding domain/chain
MNNPPRHIRLLTATSLFDGHDAAINIMRRIFQGRGVEVIHLGHNRSVREIAEAAIEEDVQAIAITSYQGGHIEFFKYLKDLLVESGCGHIRIFGGGGGTILPAEIKELQEYGICRIYSPDDGREMGLEGMIDDVIRLTEKTFDPEEPATSQFWKADAYWNEVPPLSEYRDIRRIARAISIAENGMIDPAVRQNDQPPRIAKETRSLRGEAGKQESYLSEAKIKTPVSAGAGEEMKPGSRNFPGRNDHSSQTISIPVIGITEIRGSPAGRQDPDEQHPFSPRLYAFPGYPRNGRGAERLCAGCAGYLSRCCLRPHHPGICRHRPERYFHPGLLRSEHLRDDA